MSRPYRVRPTIAVLCAILAFQAVTAVLSTMVFTLVPADVLPVRFQLYTTCLSLGGAFALGVLRVLLPDDVIVVVHNPPPSP